MDTCVDTKKARRRRRAQSSELRLGAPDEMWKGCARRDDDGQRVRGRFFNRVSEFEIDIQIFDEFVGLIQPDWVRSVVAAVLESESEARGQHVSAVIADDEVVRELNRLHRGLDENTDVLAFSFTHEGQYYGDEERGDIGSGVEFALPPTVVAAASLGEIIVSYPQARRQAEDAGHPVERELAVLLVHGVLHLLGYDHEARDDETRMNTAQAQAMERIA